MISVVVIWKEICNWVSVSITGDCLINFTWLNQVGVRRFWFVIFVFPSKIKPLVLDLTSIVKSKFSGLIDRRFFTPETSIVN